MSKNYYVLFILFSCFMVDVLHAGSQEELFLQAHKLYQHEKFEDAFSLYASLSKKNSAVWENMGNCSFYLDEYPEAIVYWRRAQLNVTRTRYRVLEDRINQALQKLHFEHSVPWYEKSAIVLVGYMHYIPFFCWQLGFLFCWLLLVWYGFLFFVHRRRFSLFLLLTLTALFALCVSIYYWQRHTKRGIVMRDSTMHTGMNEQLPILTRLKPGQHVTIGDTLSEWYSISDGKLRGWVEKNKIEVVE